jgi:hypothetical protein
MNASSLAFLVLIGACSGAAVASGESGTDLGTAPAKPSSPWLLVPVVSSDPKLGTSGGIMAGYLHHFDAESPVSLFGMLATYTTTQSSTASAFARTFFGQNRHRLIAGVAGAKINNDYSDYLNTGVTVQSQDRLHGEFARYTYRIAGPWRLGAQVAHTNYDIIPADETSAVFLDAAGLTGFTSTGVGLVGNYDSRDDVNTTRSGVFADANNIAYLKSLGGKVSFGAYRFMVKQYLPHGNGFVFGWKLSNHWTHDAPPSGYAALRLRGYTAGEYLAPSMSAIEAEERIPMAQRWGFTAFTGVGCLYGHGASCSDGQNVYPEAGGGVYYMLRPREKIALTAEFAKGKGSNQGFYMRMGWGF